MLQVTKILHQGHGLAKVVLNRAATVELDWAVRQQNRFECTDSQGRQLAVLLPHGTVLRRGDVLVGEDGSMVRVLARPQPVMVVRPGEHGSAGDLLRAAYLLGSRHVAIEVQAHHLQIEPDAVLAGMLRAMRLAVADTFAPFEPEPAALGAHGAHEHEDHHHGHRHTDTPEPHEHDTQVHDHEHDSHRHGEHGQSSAR